VDVFAGNIFSKGFPDFDKFKDISMKRKIISYFPGLMGTLIKVKKLVNVLSIRNNKYTAHTPS